MGSNVRATRHITWSTVPLGSLPDPIARLRVDWATCRWTELGRWIATHRNLVVGVFFIAVVAVAAIFAPVVAPYSPDAQLYQMRLAPPGSAYLLGGDALGRDVLSRLIYAGRISLLVALPSTLIALIVGVGLGSL